MSPGIRKLYLNGCQEHTGIVIRMDSARVRVE